MKQIKLDNKIITGIKEDNISQIILNIDLKVNDEICLISDKEEIVVEITGISKYSSLEDCIKMIPIDLFGFNKIEELKKIYRYRKKFYAYRIKYKSNYIEKIEDKKLLELIDINSLEKNNVGHSSTNVYEVKLKDGTKAILKTQKLSNRNDLSNEYEKIKWLQGKCNIGKIFYYGTNKNTKYLLREKIEGLSAHKTEGFAKKVGKVLKEFHSIDIKNCKFKENDVDNLLKNALDNIDIILPQVQEKYPDMSKKDVISFLKNNIPKDKVLIHGDFSLPNILINEKGEVGLIDLGDVSISTKYFDFFHLRKSLIRNKKIEYLDELLESYGIDKLDEKSLKWIEIIDMAMF